MKPPRRNSALPPSSVSAPAAPQCISGRTSYLRVRLAFHPYPQLIRTFCNRYRCGPPRPVTGASAWPWVAHTVSGLLHATGCAFHTRVRSASGCHCLKHATHSNSSGHSPKGTRSRLLLAQPCALTAWTRSVSGSVSLPSPGCFSPFPHGTVRYRSRQVACLGPWSAQLPTRLLVSRGTRDPRHSAFYTRYGTLTRSGASFQTLPSSTTPLLLVRQNQRQVSQPRRRNGCHLGTASV